MDTGTAIPVPRLIDAEGFGDLFRALLAAGSRVIGPSVQDGAIVLGELPSAEELPFPGVRACDPRAIAIQGRAVEQPGLRYAARRARLLIVAVNCTEPGRTGLCASAGTGPGPAPRSGTSWISPGRSVTTW